MAKSGPSAIIDHGANPGLVSHFVKLGLKQITEKVLQDSDDHHRNLKLSSDLKDKAWNELARSLGVKVIHISERDTQISDQPKEINEFVNTWSPQGLYEEAVAPAELGWGTHEERLPSNGVEHSKGPQNQILLLSKGMDTFVRSWVPNYDIIGMVIRHGEAYTISDYLTVYDQSGKPIYRPTVHYAYCPSDATVASLHELRMNHYKMPSRVRILKDDVIKGEDILGCLIMGHDYKSWWIGSILDIQEARRLVPGQNATTVQVAAAVSAGVRWMIKNPQKGVLIPDELPYDEILEITMPYLGKFISSPVDWSPLQAVSAESSFDYYRRPNPGEETWQFDNFRVSF